ncbi:MAG: hypothetical protein ACR2PI_25095 [Hyphomicrobiaceae bacterium]
MVDHVTRSESQTPHPTMAASIVANATSGRETLANIEQTIEDLRAKERALHDALETITESRSKQIEQRLAAYRELAEVRTRHAISDGVIDEADRLSTRVANLLIARQKTVAELKSRLAKADDERATLIRARKALADRIEKLEVVLDKLALDARQQLTGDADYRHDLKAAENVAAIHAKAAEKAERAETDRVNKGRAYETDRLFMYLWRRKYATGSYRPSGLFARVTRWLDGVVADHIGFHDARANYAVLNEIPVRLKAHVDGLAADLKAKRERVEARETAKIREIAGADVPRQLREARVAETQNQQAVEEVSAELSDVGEQLNKYAEGQDPAFAKAVEMSAEFLGQERTTRLMQLARETKSPSDDEIAARIARLDRQIAKAAKDIDAKTQELEKLFEKRDELVRIAADFRRAHYDDPASIFRGNDVGTVLLEELIRGAIDGADYWARARRRQSWRRRPADPYRRSENFPPFDDLFGGSGGGDGWGGGDSWSHGDDDFGTGGGF